MFIVDEVYSRELVIPMRAEHRSQVEGEITLAIDQQRQETPHAQQRGWGEGDLPEPTSHAS